MSNKYLEASHKRVGLTDYFSRVVERSWVLIAFKREFPFDDVLSLWEVCRIYSYGFNILKCRQILWTDYYCDQFLLFVALAVLESHRDGILRYLVEV